MSGHNGSKTVGYIVGIKGEAQPSLDLLMEWINTGIEKHQMAGEVSIECLGDLQLDEEPE